MMRFRILIIIAFSFLVTNSFSQEGFHKLIEVRHPDSVKNYLGWPYTINFFNNEIYALEFGVYRLNKQAQVQNAHYINIGYNSIDFVDDHLIGFGTGLPYSSKSKNELLKTKFDIDGIVKNHVLFKGFSSDYQIAKSLKVLPNGQIIYVCHQQYSNENYKRGLFLKTDKNDKAMLAMEISDSLSTSLYKVDTDKKGNIYLFGEMLTKSKDTEFFVIKLTSKGLLVWSKMFGGYTMDDPHDAMVDNSGNLYLVGQTLSHSKHGGADAFVVKLDSNGIQQWAKVYGDSRHDGFWKIKEVKNGDIYVLGRKEILMRSCKSMGCDDVYFLNIDSLGNILEGVTLGVDNKWDVGYCFDISPSNEMIIGGQSIETDNTVIPNAAFFYSTNGMKGFCNYKLDSSKVASFTFSESSGPTLRNIPLFKDSVVSRINRDVTSYAETDTYCSTVSLPENMETKKRFKVYPNPTSQKLNISGELRLNKTIKTKLYTLQGKLVLEKELLVNQKLDVSELQTGTYVLLLNTGEFTQREIVLVE